VVSFPQVSSPKLYIHLSSPYTCYLPHPSHSSRFDHSNNIWWGVKVIKFLIMQFSPFLCYLAHLWPKYSPQHRILKQPHPTFLPHYERPSFIPIQKKRQNYSSVYMYGHILFFLQSAQLPTQWVSKTIFPVVKGTEHKAGHSSPPNVQVMINWS
jgi:hypothetical protein